MNPDEAKALIANEIRVERSHVVAAKAFVLQQRDEGGTLDVAQKWGREVAGEPPAVFRLHEGDSVQIAAQYARYFSAQLAMFQAVWELIGVALLLPAGAITRSHFKVNWTTGRQSAGLDFPEVSLPYFENFARPQAAPETVLTDGDLYLSGLPSASLHPGVKEALRMAVACFRRELFVPAAAMLGAASEGAWIELGRALVARNPNESICKKVVAILEADVTPMRAIITSITEQLFTRQDLLDECAQSSGVKLHRLRDIAIWSHTVREARNVLHWGASPNSSNTYEGVGVLLMSALQNIGDLEKLRVAATASQG